MTISGKVKLEVGSDVSIKLIHFDNDGNIIKKGSEYLAASY